MLKNKRCWLSQKTVLAMVLASALLPVAALAQMGDSASMGSGQSGHSMMGGGPHTNSSKPMAGNTSKSGESARVKSIQAALNRKEHAHLAIDGKMGHQTRMALEKFQKAHGLKPTGHPDKATDHALGM
ncbi:MAG: peptidoglycan-binding domain-containing protein [Acidiferrobacter sp.]